MTPQDRSRLELAEEQAAQEQREARRRAREDKSVEEIREILGGTIIEEEDA